MGTTHPESALSEVITDAIRGKKVSKWVIQLLLIFGISIVIKQLLELTDIAFFSYLLIVFAALFLSFLLSLHYRNWLETLIKDASSNALEHDAAELMTFIGEVLVERKSILDFIKPGRNALRIAILGISNTLFIISLFLLGDAFFANILGESALTQAGYIGGLLIIIISLTLYIYFEIKPIQDNPEMQHVSQDNILPLFMKKLHENIAIGEKGRYVSFASLISLFFLIPHLNIEKQGFWLGVYLCTPELRDFIMDLTKKENCIKIHHLDSLDDFFVCDKTGGLEDLVNLQSFLPIEIYNRFRGVIGKEHPKKMKGLTIKLCNQNQKKRKSRNRNRIFLTMHIIPWKGCVIKKSLKHRGSSKRPEEYPYKVIQAIEDRRVFTIFMIGTSDSVESYKFQFSLKAPQAAAENISFGSHKR